MGARPSSRALRLGGANLEPRGPQVGPDSYLVLARLCSQEQPPILAVCPVEEVGTEPKTCPLRMRLVL